jgi:OmcA/MtrC family decaheme c-type cytochrome
MLPEVSVSFYGWDSKQFIVASHTRDGSTACSTRGCRMEYAPGDTNALFTEDTASVPGDWMVTLDMAAYVPTEVLTDDIPTMIANGDIKMAEITVTPELTLGTVELGLDGVTQTFNLGTSVMVNDYFKGANATVDVEKCNDCHDQLAVTFHGGGRGGDIVICKNCHVTTSPGSHLELASRAIDSYVHAIHSFQPFDLDDVDEDDDPVFDARAEMHAGHTFPNFTIKNCEGCHVAGTFNVPDQSESMPGVLRASWDIADRNVGTIPEAVTGPASRACGGCHRADMLAEDNAGDLASFNAHTQAFGTFEENDEDDLVLYGVIDKIMSMFE